MSTACNKDSQTVQILEHLRSKRSITPQDAYVEYGCMRLGARIYDLKQAGHNIQMDFVDIGQKRVAEYRLVEVGRAGQARLG